MEENGSVKAKLGGIWIAAMIVLLIGVIGSTAIGVCSLLTLRTYIAEQDEDTTAETTEDYVTIAENYEILPTTNISDAYKSGDTSALTDKEKETLDMAEAALAEMGIEDSMSDYEKEKAVYDWMTSSLQQDSGALTVIPSTTEDCDNPYGVLKYHNAVCVGYATTFRLFMQMMDIECMIEHNTELYHSWDIVKLDGDWYITDIYSDAGNGNYAHFNMTDSMWSQMQNWDRDFFPAATSMKYNMAYQNKKTVKSVYDIASAVREAMDEKLGSVMIAFEQEITDADAQIASSMASSIDNQLMMYSYQDMPYCLNGYNWIQDPEDGSYLYDITFGNYNSTDTSTTLTEEQQEKVQEKVTEAFEGLTSSMYSDGSYSTIEGETTTFGGEYTDTSNDIESTEEMKKMEGLATPQG
jgi:hypothetical protein